MDKVLLNYYKYKTSSNSEYPFLEPSLANQVAGPIQSLRLKENCTIAKMVLLDC